MWMKRAFLCKAVISLVLARSCMPFTACCTFIQYGTILYHFTPGRFLSKVSYNFIMERTARSAIFMKGECTEPDAVGKFHHGVAQSPRRSGTFTKGECAEPDAVCNFMGVHSA